ncbi:lipopolysaccharide/colanic/teichoic acid biosynthesis glycosyltransferase [Rhodoblastus acidophilus]|uniref:sugar transferase n=1 Tax=Rhodoblastus acidophilus TaxID=1074 RepID=UPI0022258B07|nr:sugar transferase [Rhodoblastus acidophilus]MCW2283828.1 lipopolysaccharide/colanic/teichoic acid biosynthesis glycosyltransferase [Rhodoblastus acidophilus]MCW2335634.1 lipopolysaccharide/colanic/teichoic acid biosynthesis glycosyltransferase [Rhodoblastus acidophilus]
MRVGAPTSKSRFAWKLSPFDAAWVVISPFIAIALRDPGLLYFDSQFDYIPHGYQYALFTIICAIPPFLFFRISDGLTRYFSVNDLKMVLAATFCTVALSAMALFLANRLEGVPRSTPLIYGLVLAAGLLGGRGLSRHSPFRVPSSSVKPERHHLRRVVLVGIDRFVEIVIKLTDCQNPRTTQIVAAVDPRERLHGRTVNGVKIVGHPNDLEAILDEYTVHGVDVDEVWIADDAFTRAEFISLESTCRNLGVKALSISRALNLGPASAPVFRSAQREPQLAAPHRGYFRFKRAIDVLVAVTLIVLTAPIALFIAALTYLDVGSPVIFWQQRLGHRGRDFYLFKFRTYQAPYRKNGDRVDSEARLSPIGKAIRATRLDEIPQLFNILRGDMTLIGPRPLLPVDQPEDPRLRLLVRPGVTGWAQVVGGTAVSAEEKDALDVWYIHHASPALDIKILFRTLQVVFRGERKNDEDISTAVRWRKATRQMEHQLLGDRVNVKGARSNSACKSDNFDEGASPSGASL